MALRIKIAIGLFWTILTITIGWLPKMALLPVFVPFLSFLAIAINGRFIGYNGASLVTCFGMFFATLTSAFVFIYVCLHHKVIVVTATPWIVYKDLIEIKWEFLFDSLTVVMMLVVCFISLLVHIYSINYMYEDAHFAKFMGFLSLFTFFMLMLVTSNNLLQLFFGWEGVGISSYLLINFWNKRIQANKAAIKAILFNRVGDMGLALATGLAFYMFKSVSFQVIFPAIAAAQWAHFEILEFSIDPMSLLAFLLFVGAAGKSAQLGLHTWLPDAMEGPTPVSALIHAATMVTAGVFVLIRCGPILDQSPLVLGIINFIGALTAFFAASTALFQNDLKRLI
jgi:NADH-quinone oxidoreductase subunit L